MSQLGRISGHLLEANLLRNNVDLSFETDLLYLDVNSNRVGIKTTPGIYDLDINDSVRSTDLDISGAANIYNIIIDASGTFTTSVGPINLIPAQTSPYIFHGQLVTDDLNFNDNVISSFSDANIEFRPNASGTTELKGNTNIDGNLRVYGTYPEQGNISLDGNLSSVSNIIVGDSPLDTVDVQTDFTQDVEPGTTLTYDLGTADKRWAELYAVDETTVNNYIAAAVNISTQLRLDGIINKIYALQSDDDVILDPDTGILYVEELKFGEGGWNLGYTLDNPNAFGTSADDYFGHSVAISGDRAIVGALFEDDTISLPSSGKAYIFDVTTGSLLHTLDNPNAYSTSANDQFGAAVDIDGDRCIVGARGEDEPGMINSGKAYVFDVTSGSLLYTLDNPNAFSSPFSDLFGNKVAISGDRCIVGAQDEDDAGGSSSGKAYLFDLTSYSLNTYNVQFEFGRADNNDGTLTIDLVSLGIPIGELAVSCDIDSIDIRGDLSSSSTEYIYLKLSTSASYDFYTSTADDATYRNKTWSGGRVTLNTSKTFNVDYVIPTGVNFSPSGMPSGFYWQVRFNLTVTTMSGVTVLDNPNAYSISDADRFGSSVAISGDRCIVGAYSEDDPSGSGASGKAYIFDATDGSLLHTLDNPNAFGTSSADFFGWSVAISGDRCIVGAYAEDDAGGTGSGKAYIFDVSTGALVHTLDNPTAFGTSAGDEFGYSVGIDNDRAIVGAFVEDDAGGTNSGKAYIFDVSTGALVHTLDNPTAFGTSDNDRFGYSVGIDGDRAIVSATFEDDAGGTTSGKAYVFENTLNQSIIKNLNPTTPVQFASTGIGYVKFEGTNGVVIPSGTDAQRPARPEIGDTRWNTDEGYLECFAGEIESVSVAGSISGLGNQETLISPTVTDGNGQAARFNFIIDAGALTIRIINPGAGYKTGDTLTVLGNLLSGGATPSNDLTLTVGAQTKDGYTISTGGGETVTVPFMEELIDVYTLVLG